MTASPKDAGGYVERSRVPILNVLPKGMKFCSAYDLSRIMDPLSVALQPGQ
jgi:hypothetical protein